MTERPMRLLLCLRKNPHSLPQVRHLYGKRGIVMKTFVPSQLMLCPMPQREIRGLSFTSAIRSGLRPYEYKSVIEASCLEAILDFKIWGKTSCLGCYFRDISTGEKFVL